MLVQTSTYTTAIITSVATLTGVGITLFWTSALKKQEYSESRRNTKRAERREVYRETLKYSRGVHDYWQGIGSWDNIAFDPLLTLSQAKADRQDDEKYRDLKTDIQLVASEAIVEALTDFYDAIEQCRLSYIMEYQNTGISDPNSEEVAVREVRAAVAKTFGKEDVHGKYENLRNQVRGELNLPEELVPYDRFSQSFSSEKPNSNSRPQQRSDQAALLGVALAGIVALFVEPGPKLREELLNFRRKQNTRTAHISYEHWRESDHDDLVLAAALACWKATYQRKGTTRLKVFY